MIKTAKSHLTLRCNFHYFRINSYNTNGQASGYYIVDSSEHGNPNLVYCDLTKRLFDPNIEVNYGPVIYNEKKLKHVWFEVIKDDYCSTYGQNTRKIDFNKISFNVGNAVNTYKKEFIAPIEGWYHFIASGTSYYYQSRTKVKTIKNIGHTKEENFYRGEPYGSHKDSFRTTIFSRHLAIGDKIEISEYGYKFCPTSPFRFTGYLIPET